MVYYTFTTGARLNRPWVQPGLSRIPLRIMYDKALAADVPFLDFPSGGDYAVPDELSQLAGTLASGGAMPSIANQREILRNYGHVSSNFGSIGMEPQLGTGAQRMWHRTIYRNDTGQAR